jgi:lysozyme family protein
MDKFPESVRLAHFDMTVNAGPGNSTRVLQRALIQCGQNVSIDGEAGEKTLTACKLVDGEKLSMAYTIQRVVYYFKIVVSRPKNAKFFYGWIRRTLEVMQGK